MSIPYRPEIDGLRAVAVIPVILFHLGFREVSGGFVGVDVFFVISGFLITSILLREVSEGKYSLWSFWQRRIRRIVPALVSVLLAVTVFSFFWVFPSEGREFGRQGVAATFSLANVYFWRLGMDYWAPQAEDSPFLHTWSLSVEEQFYLIYPMALVWLLRRGKRWVVWGGGLVVIASYVLWVHGALSHPSASFFLLPFRAWELGIGGGLAFWFHHGGGTGAADLRVQQFGSLVGLLFIGGSLIGLSGEQNASWPLIFPVVGAALIICFAQSGTVVHRLLTISAMIRVGKISYSLYLWHWPIIVLSPYAFDHTHPAWQIAAMLGVAMGSYRWIEQPARRGVFGLRSIGLGFVVCFVLLVGLASFDRHFDTSRYSEVVWEGQRFDVYPVHAELTGAVARRMRGLTIVPREEGLERAFAEEGIIHNYGDGPPTIMLTGDSHGIMWAGVLDEIAAELEQTICHFSMAGVRPFIQLPISRDQQLHISEQDKYDFDQSRYDAIKRWRPIVLVAARWAELRSYDRAAAEEYVNWLAAEGVIVGMLGQPPEPGIGDNNAPEYLSHLGLAPVEGRSQYVRMGNRENYWQGAAWLDQLISESPACHKISIRDLYLRDESEVRVLDEDRVLYIDDDHLSRAGALLAKDRIKEAILQLLVERRRLIGK